MSQRGTLGCTWVPGPTEGQVRGYRGTMTMAMTKAGLLRGYNNLEGQGYSGLQ